MFPCLHFLDITDNIFISFFIAPGLAKSTRCYGKYGCYSNKAPFNRIVLLPLPPWVVSPKFRLYTRLYPDTPQFIDDNDVTKLQQSNYNGTKKTVLIVHGYVGELAIIKRMIRMICSLRKLYLLSAQSRIEYWIFCNKVAVTRLTGPFIIYHGGGGGQRILAGGGGRG